MARVHFLNVKQGDCTIIQHNSGRTTVIDVCNARLVRSLTETALSKFAQIAAQLEETKGNFKQKRYPVNPIEYMKSRGIDSVYRYIQTHPDMDHMDGLKDIFEQFAPPNFWDTDNNKEMPDDADWSRFRESDWLFYKRLRDAWPTTGPKRLSLLSGAQGKYFNQGDDGRSGDGLYVLSPTAELLCTGNACGEFNDCSYVLLYRVAGRRLVFAGDSHDGSWTHILSEHGAELRDIDLLIAPHHGRDSDRDFGFLDILNPTVTFFGVARSDHLAYDEWRRRGLVVVTNNQANTMIVDISNSLMRLFATHKNYATSENPEAYYDHSVMGWHVWDIERR